MTSTKVSIFWFIVSSWFQVKSPNFASTQNAPMKHVAISRNFRMSRLCRQHYLMLNSRRQVFRKTIKKCPVAHISGPPIRLAWCLQEFDILTTSESACQEAKRETEELQSMGGRRILVQGKHLPGQVQFLLFLFSSMIFLQKQNRVMQQLTDDRSGQFINGFFLFFTQIEMT